MNGILGGNVSLGTVGGRIDAVYRAPAGKPSPATVTVSVEIPWKSNRREKALSLANIRVTSGYTGIVSIKALHNGQLIELQSTVEWTEPSGVPNTYRPT